MKREIDGRGEADGTRSDNDDGRVEGRAPGKLGRRGVTERLVGVAHACNFSHISASRSVVQMRGVSMPLASSWARDTLKGRQCS